MDEAEAKRARRLPPGPHGLPPELVERNQRERLIAAMAEVCGERGYVEASVAEVSRRAGVSTASFYRQFKDKRECMLVSFEELCGRLLAEIRQACRKDAAEGIGGTAKGARAAARLLAADLPTARLLSLEVLAVGREGALAQHRAIEEVAGMLRAPGAKEKGSADAAWAAAAAMFSLVAVGTATGRAPEPGDLEALAASASETKR